MLSAKCSAVTQFPQAVHSKFSNALNNRFSFLEKFSLNQNQFTAIIDPLILEFQNIVFMFLDLRCAFAMKIAHDKS